MRAACLIWQGTRWRGGWNYYLNMARVLRDHCPDLRLSVFAPADIDASARAEAEEAAGEAVGVLPSPSRIRDVSRLIAGHDRGLATTLKAAGVDVVIEQASFLGRDFPVPVVSWIADLQHRTYPEYFTLKGRLTRDVGYWAQTRFRRHVYVSSASAGRDLTSFIARPRAEIHVVPFAVQPTVPITLEGVRAVRRRHDLPDRYAFLPNQLWRHKNHRTAVRAMGLLAQRGRDIRLVLSGGGGAEHDRTYVEELTALTEEVGAAANLQWLGSVPYPDLLHLMAGARTLVNPSLFEGWSTTVEEAKALGVPMILSDIDVHLEQAEGQARFFAAEDPAALADALEAAWDRPRSDLEAAWAGAAERNRADQRAYAQRLRALFLAAVGGADA